MPSQSKNDSQSAARTKLTIPRIEAAVQLDRRIEIGRELGERDIAGPEELARSDTDRERWNKYNGDMLRSRFSDEKLGDEYDRWDVYITSLDEKNLSEKIDDFRSDVRDKTARLESIKDRLELYEEPAVVRHSSRHDNTHSTTSRKVFLVHGTDEGARHTVARALEKLDLEVVILHEQAARGRTLIEKFEAHADVAFTVVVLTSDDVGHSVDQSEMVRPRARQNVILELGYFIGYLGRNNVCAIKQGDIELPSDILGVEYIPMDDGGVWRYKVAGEIKAAGIDVDLNRLTRS